jgi:hypothetical protein
MFTYFRRKSCNYFHLNLPAMLNTFARQFFLNFFHWNSAMSIPKILIKFPPFLINLYFVFGTETYPHENIESYFSILKRFLLLFQYTIQVRRMIQFWESLKTECLNWKSRVMRYLKKNNYGFNNIYKN